MSSRHRSRDLGKVLVAGRMGLAAGRVAALVAALAGLLGLATAVHAAGERRAPSPVRADSIQLPPEPQVPTAPLLTDSLPRALALPPAPPRPPTPEAPLRRKTLAYDLVRAGQDVFIGEDEVVRGDVILLGGDLRAEGAIQGSAVVVVGGIELGRGARVEGEVVALGGRVEREPGAQVRGSVVGLSLFPRPLAGGVDWRRARDVGTLVGDLVGAALVLGWTLLVAMAGRQRLRRARGWIEAAPWRTTGLGVVGLTGGLFAVVMGIVLLAITLVGLPIALLVAVFTIFVLLVGQAVGLVHLGSWVCGLLRLPVRSPLVLGVVGVLIVGAPQLLADILRLSQRGVVTQFQVLHVLLVAGTLAAGLGALVLSRLGRHPAPSAGPVVAAAAPPAEAQRVDGASAAW